VDQSASTHDEIVYQTRAQETPRLWCRSVGLTKLKVVVPAPKSPGIHAKNYLRSRKLPLISLQTSHLGMICRKSNTFPERWLANCDHYCASVPDWASGETWKSTRGSKYLEVRLLETIIVRTLSHRFRGVTAFSEIVLVLPGPGIVVALRPLMLRLSEELDKAECVATVNLHL
jgi:hypothetical protein